MMRELIERFSYRRRLWLAEKRGKHLGAGSNPEYESKGKIVSRHLVFLLFGIFWAIVCWLIAYDYLKRGSFQYTPQDGPTQIISPTTNAAAYWRGIGTLLAVGAVGIATAAYQSVRLFRACRAPAEASQQPSYIRSMRVLMMVLALLCLLCIVSAITGIQAFELSAIQSGSRTGSVVTYWEGAWRWFALVYAAFFAVAFYGIYRRFPLAWKVGWVVVVASTAAFIVQVWLVDVQPPDAAAAWFKLAAALGGIPVGIYWGFWWYKQKRYFIPDATEQT